MHNGPGIIKNTSSAGVETLELWSFEMLKLKTLRAERSHQDRGSKSKLWQLTLREEGIWFRDLTQNVCEQSPVPFQTNPNDSQCDCEFIVAQCLFKKLDIEGSVILFINGSSLWSIKPKDPVQKCMSIGIMLLYLHQTSRWAQLNPERSARMDSPVIPYVFECHSHSFWVGEYTGGTLCMTHACAWEGESR